jgi:preprotein translocase subunit SecF
MYDYMKTYLKTITHVMGALLVTLSFASVHAFNLGLDPIAGITISGTVITGKERKNTPRIEPLEAELSKKKIKAAKKLSEKAIRAYSAAQTSPDQHTHGIRHANPAIAQLAKLYVYEQVTPIDNFRIILVT